MKITKLIMIVLAFAGLSCNATKITSSWKAADLQTKPYYNVMVWGILPKSDSTVRKQLETHMVNDLVEKGYHAVSSIDVYQAKAYEKSSGRDIVEEFKSTGVDAVITLVLLNKEKEEKYYPGGFFTKPVDTYGGIDKYYSQAYERIFTPGYYISTTDYFWEANLFEVVADKIVYSVRTRSFDPESTEILAHENALKIMKDMLRKKVIIDQNSTNK
ncbi:MAG: hypothetical protein IPL84_14760 [Chitinophagaceae bacterium]|nr:hypothetical protein [Chitinophagaceae bacterium]